MRRDAKGPASGTPVPARGDARGPVCGPRRLVLFVLPAPRPSREPLITISHQLPRACPSGSLPGGGATARQGGDSPYRPFPRPSSGGVLRSPKQEPPPISPLRGPWPLPWYACPQGAARAVYPASEVFPPSGLGRPRFSSPSSHRSAGVCGEPRHRLPGRPRRRVTLALASILTALGVLALTAAPAFAARTYDSQITGLGGYPYGGPYGVTVDSSSENVWVSANHRLRLRVQLLPFADPARQPRAAWRWLHPRPRGQRRDAPNLRRRPGTPAV